MRKAGDISRVALRPDALHILSVGHAWDFELASAGRCWSTADSLICPPAENESSYVPLLPEKTNRGGPVLSAIVVGPIARARRAEHHRKLESLRTLAEGVDQEIDVLIVYDRTPNAIDAGPALVRHWCESAVQHTNVALDNSAIAPPKRFALAGCVDLPFGACQEDTGCGNATDPLGRDFYYFATGSPWMAALREHFRADIVSYMDTATGSTGGGGAAQCSHKSRSALMSSLASHPCSHLLINVVAAGLCACSQRSKAFGALRKVEILEIPCTTPLITGALLLADIRSSTAVGTPGPCPEPASCWSPDGILLRCQHSYTKSFIISVQCTISRHMSTGGRRWGRGRTESRMARTPHRLLGHRRHCT